VTPREYEGLSVFREYGLLLEGNLGSFEKIMGFPAEGSLGYLLWAGKVDEKAEHFPVEMLLLLFIF